MTRQVPFKSFSSLMNLSLFGFFALQLNYILKKSERNSLLFLLGFVGWGFIMLGYSSVIGNSLGNSFRFLTILILIQTAFFIKPNTKYINILIGFLVLQSLFLISLHLVLNIFFNSSSYLFIRLFFQSQGWGDLYTYNGLFYNIQILGNALLPVGVFISIVYYSGLKRKVITTILFLGMMVAGNFAFILGFSVFLLLLFLVAKSYNTRRFLTIAVMGLLLGFMAAKPALSYLNKTITNKSEESNPTRIDQSKVLWENLSENPINLVFGKGLGNTLKVKTKWRDYTDNIYFELQSLYFLNQMGFLNFLGFVVSNILCVIIFFRQPKVKVIYFAYIIYAFFNPYFLDTSHIVVIIALVSLNNYLEEQQKVPETNQLIIDEN